MNRLPDGMSVEESNAMTLKMVRELQAKDEPVEREEPEEGE